MKQDIAGWGLCGRALTMRADGRTILDHVDIDIAPGTVTAVLGPNGAGKSTLLKMLAGDIAPQTGSGSLNGRPLAAWPKSELARYRAVLPQSPELAFAFLVWEVVELGRHPHRGFATAEEDDNAVQEAMRATETDKLADRSCPTLSGGEMHRTHYSRVLAQLWQPAEPGHARFLLLDEPTAGLDLFHQHAILAKAREMAASSVGVLAVLHDLNLAAAYADHVVVLTRGGVEATGAPADVLTEERIARIWRVVCEIVTGRNGKPQIIVGPQYE
jgi:iron complex transport system ATP-binding protein